MEDLSNELTRAGNLTAAMTVIKAQSDKLRDAINDLSIWKIEIDCEIDPQTFDIIVTATKPLSSTGTRAGIRQIIPAADAKYFAADPNALCDEISEMIYKQLVYNIIRDEARMKLSPLIKNVARFA